MSDESEPVSPASTNLLTLRSTLSQTTLWLQRALLMALVLAHLAVPVVFAVGSGGDLIRDVAMSAQLSLLLIAFTLLGLRWPGMVLLLSGAAVPFGIWILLFEAAYQVTGRDYLFDTLFGPGIVVAVALIGLRWRGWRGSWQSSPALDTPPWQVSIWQLLVVTTAVAIAFAGANWLRQFPSLEANYWLVVGIDSLGTAVLSLTALWALGTTGSAGLKFGVLLLIATAVAICQIFAFRMEGFWHLSAVSSLAYAILLGGTLAIWRLCGWRITRNQQQVVKIA